MARSIEQILGSAAEIEAHAGYAPAIPAPVRDAGRVTSIGGGRDLMSFGAAFDGASRWDRDLALWNPPLRSADNDVLPDKRIADSRVRDIVRNDNYMAGGKNLHQDNIVGGLYRLNSKPEAKVLGLDEAWETEFQEEVEAKFTLWAESEMNWVDASRYNTFTGLIRLGVGVYLVAGELLASVEWLRDGPRPFNTAIQMIEVDRLSNPIGKQDGPFLRGGVQRNMFGAPEGYHIRMAHPSDYNNPDMWKHRFVKIRKPWGRLQMIHIVEQQRPDQTRGISDIVAGLKEMKITRKFRDIVLQNAVVNATYAASIESELPSAAAFEAIGGGNISEALVGYTGAYMSALGQYVGNSKNMHIDGVKIPHLFPGTKLQLRPAGQGGPLGTEFEASLLRYMAAGLGVSYEQLSHDYSQTNYSSIRAAMTETWKYMQSRKRMVADRLASHVYRLWLEEAFNKGEITTAPKNAVEMWYTGLNAEAFSGCEWIGASRGQIDELKETQAAVLRIKYNLSTHEDEQSRLGKDWRKNFAQIAREKKLQKDLDIVPIAEQAEDSMMNAATGDPRESESRDEKSDGSDKAA